MSRQRTSRRSPATLPTQFAQMTWNAVRGPLHRFLLWVIDNWSGIPGGWFNETPEPVAADEGSAGTEASGWAAADHTHDGRHTLLDGSLHTDTSVGLPAEGATISGDGDLWNVSDVLEAFDAVTDDGSNVRILDRTVLAGESLNEGNFATTTKWTRAGDFAFSGGKAVYTHSSGSGTITQTSADGAIPWFEIGQNSWFKLVYTVSSVTGVPVAVITSAFAAATETLDVTAGTHTLYFLAKAGYQAVGSFVISVSSSATATISFDDLSLKMVIGGNLNVGGSFSMHGNEIIPAGINWSKNTVYGYTAALDDNEIFTSAFGTGAAQTNSGTKTSAFGWGALGENTGDFPSGFGHLSLFGNTGDRCSGFGLQSLLNNTGEDSSGFGKSALENNAGARNSGFGSLVLTAVSGTDNTAIGYQAASAPAGVGANGLTSGSQNTYLGAETGANSTSQRTNTTTIGYRALSTADNQISLGNSSVTQHRAAGLTLTAGTTAEESGGLLRSVISSYLWTNAQIVALGGVTAGDITVATLPAKTVVKNAYIVITGQGAGVATLTVAFGRVSAAFDDYVVASDAEAAVGTVYGDGAAERGVNLTGFDLPSYAGTTVVKVHFISTGGNLSAVTGSTGRVVIETMLIP